MNKTFRISLFIVLLLLNSLSSIKIIGKDEITVISTRISHIDEIQINIFPDLIKPNTTQFSFNATVEILNNSNENQTVIELADRSPKVYFNSSLVNTSIKLELWVISHSTIMDYSYVPGITEENNLMILYLNQTGLTYLPDGNYTLWRPIQIGNQITELISGEALLTTILMNKGVMTINYPKFSNYVPSNSSFPHILQLSMLLMIVIIVFKKRKNK